MNQQTFSNIEYSGRTRITKREEFLDTMNEIIPWEEWVDLIKPFYYKGKRGRPPMGIEKMLRMYLLQGWFNLSDEGVEDAIYDSYAMRKFMDINFLEEGALDATTLLKFWRILENSGLGKAMFEGIVKGLESAGQIMRGGSIVDATIINAPSSTKNKKKERDSEMKQTMKGKEWKFGMKVHIGVDAGSGYVTAVEGSSANVHDVTVASKLLRPDDHVMYGDSAYLGLEKREEIVNHPTLSGIESRENRRPGNTYRKYANDGQAWEKEIERQKSAVRSKVEFPFRFLKVQCGFRKTVYKGIMKNLNRAFMLLASCNLYACARAGRSLCPVTG
ncbi:MAG: IS5 family transposase [Christensenellales bacterium]